MKVYRNVAFRGTLQTLEKFIADVELRLSDGWARNHARESEVRRAALGPMYCFSFTAAGDRGAGELWLATWSDGSLYVSNIVADPYWPLTSDQYNAIVQEFHDRFTRPAAEAVGVKVELGNPDPQIEDYLSPRATTLLRRFSGLANRAILHPRDREHWNEFLAATHREDAPLEASMLQRWLIEDEKWPEDEAIKLAIEYEHARDLLGVYESKAG